MPPLWQVIPKLLQYAVSALDPCLSCLQSSVDSLTTDKDMNHGRHTSTSIQFHDRASTLAGSLQFPPLLLLAALPIAAASTLALTSLLTCDHDCF